MTLLPISLAGLVMAMLNFKILAEEEVCLKRYGESYRAFMARTPRYLLFF